jgi:hypothetical protein
MIRIRHTIPAALWLLAPTIALAQTPRWSLVPEMRIGSPDDPSYALTRVSAVTVGPDGRLDVAQPMDANLRVFDRSGEFVRTIGRRGQSPGEFQDITSMGWRGDSLWVVDLLLSRVTYFSPDGTHLHTARVAGPMLEYSSRPTAPEVVFGDGSILAVPMTGDRPDIEVLPILRLDRVGGLLGEVARIRVAGEFKRARGAGFGVSIRLPVRDNTLWGVSPDGAHLVLVDRPIAAAADAARFHVTKLDAAGDTVFHRRFRYVPRPVPEGVQDSIRARYAEFWARAIDPATARELARDSIPFPPFQAPVSDFFVARDGRIWLQRERLGMREVEWLVLAADGGIAGSVGVPAEVMLRYADGEVVWGVEEDRLEVPYLARYRVVRRTAASPGA